jgi:plastocyanin
MTSADSRPSLKRRAAWFLAVCCAAPAAAGTLHVKVVDAHGEPVARVAVYAVPSSPSARAAAAAPRATPDATPGATMDQAHNAFVPHVLIVQAGTSVLFPNNDVVSHHVYSFSDTKSFELPLYKGNAHPPLLFEKPGLIVLGCNIHDGMLGYIRVVDTPHHSLTDRDGTLALESLPAGDYTLHVWTPRLKPSDLPAEEMLTLAASDDVTRVYRLEGKLLPDHDQAGSSLTWERY